LADEDGAHEGGAHEGGAHEGGAHDGGAHDGADIGSELFALVARARTAGIDPESELRAAARRYRDRVRAWERSRPA
jgi:XTP/dITP diphosphohydrolase